MFPDLQPSQVHLMQGRGEPSQYEYGFQQVAIFSCLRNFWFWRFVCMSQFAVVYSKKQKKKDAKRSL
ncbi:hypothetical protein CJD36_001230 [Flavipsychrobacter stenotrophus]|uniref:Uncharacterized protein n=1 Tax=Flavipsychrobacter stenotrophus TaxID=2077091 RepID=A0A2S7SZP5_9BACT|nr:hypothetical protein CJD36_001230 [Flavipsychrobacter stenotrophus]